MNNNEWLGWHFLCEDGKLQFPPRKKVKVGQTLKVKGPLELCRVGLHASKNALDALGYAPGPIVCRVRLSGEIIEGDDKACATERTVLWMADATEALHRMSIWSATRALKRERKAGREPDKRSWAAIKAKEDWLAGRITDDELFAARDAARAARDAARAARDASWAAAWDAAWAAARDASWAAAWDVARAAERKAHDKQLTKLLTALNQERGD